MITDNHTIYSEQSKLIKCLSQHFIISLLLYMCCMTSAAALKATLINDANYHQAWCVDNHNVGHHLHPSLFNKPKTFITAALPSAVQKTIQRRPLSLGQIILVWSQFLCSRSCTMHVARCSIWMAERTTIKGFFSSRYTQVVLQIWKIKFCRYHTHLAIQFVNNHITLEMWPTVHHREWRLRNTLLNQNVNFNMYIV